MAVKYINKRESSGLDLDAEVEYNPDVFLFVFVLRRSGEEGGGGIRILVFDI